jgi:hypothetical protein
MPEPAIAQFYPSTGERMHIVTDKGIFRLEAAKFLGTPDDLIAQLTQDASHKLPDVFVTTHEGESLPPLRHTVVVNGGHAYLATRLSSVRLRTFFSVNPDGIASPVFTNAHDRSAVHLDLTWTPPPDMRLHLGLVATMPGEDGAPYVFGDAYFYVTKTGTPGFFRLPLPNVYEDSRVCMGRGMERAEEPTLAGLLARARAHFLASSWNSDLIHLIDTSRAFFSFRLADNNAPVYPDDWATLAPRVSHPSFERFIVRE